MYTRTTRLKKVPLWVVEALNQTIGNWLLSGMQCERVGKKWVTHFTLRHISKWPHSLEVGEDHFAFYARMSALNRLRLLPTWFLAEWSLFVQELKEKL